MPHTRTLIKIAASILYTLRSQDLTQAHPRFLVFTGSSGKTLTRSLVVHGLKKAGTPTSSPQTGYTNELGVVLAALGISEFSIKSPRAWIRALRCHVPQNTFVCIELGADFREDIEWFLARWKPYFVFLTDSDATVPFKNSSQVHHQRMELLNAAPKENRITLSSGGIHLVPTEEGALHKISVPSLPHVHFLFPFPVFTPHQRALELSVRFLHAEVPHVLTENLFFDLNPDMQRLHVQQTKNGATIISDTYKAIPFCTNWFVRMATQIPSDKKVLILSELRPRPRKEREFYTQLAQLLPVFDSVIFFGSKRVYRYLAPVTSVIFAGPSVRSRFLRALSTLPISKNSTLFIKGSSHYHLDVIFEWLTKNH